MVWWRTGSDPYYLFEEGHFHQTCKIACDKHNPIFYPKYKKQCDNYFGTYIGMARGVGGLFFDYCKTNEEQSMQDWFNFVTEVGDSFLKRMFQ
jgi:coproporphyrinogen III oxidase